MDYSAHNAYEVYFMNNNTWFDHPVVRRALSLLAALVMVAGICPVTAVQAEAQYGYVNYEDVRFRRQANSTTTWALLDEGWVVEIRDEKRSGGVDYYYVVSNIPIHELGDKFSKAGLYGMKINIYSEMKNTKIPDISTFKSVTSGDTISGEYKNQDRFSFDPKVKLLYAGNSFPFSKESDHTSAFLNRICILIFGKSIPVDKQDKNLSKKLWKERDVIFSLAMEELRKLKKNKFQFVVSEDSKKFLQNYEKMQNSVDSFVEEFCEFGKDNYLAITNFRNIYSAFCHENAFEVLKDEDLVARLHGKFNVTRKDKLHRGSYNRASFMGISWKSEYKFFNDPAYGTKAGIPSFQVLFNRTEPELNEQN